MFIIKEYSIVIKLNEVNKILYSYDIKNDIVDENNKEILTQTVKFQIMFPLVSHLCFHFFKQVSRV